MAADTPTPHSERRMELARSMLPGLIIPDVAVAVVGGSVARGCADAYSDLEIGLVWREPPSESVKRRLMEPFGYVDDDTVFVGGRSISDGFKVDIIHATLHDVVAALAGEPDAGELREFLWTCVPLHGARSLRSWQDALRTQFERDWAETAARYVGGLSRAWARVDTAPLDDPLACRDCQAGIISALVCTLCVAHRELPSDKWLHWSIAQAPDCYADVPSRMNEALHRPPADCFESLRAICSESIDLLAAQKPEIDLEGVREAIVNARPGQSPHPVPELKPSTLEERDAAFRREVDLPWYAHNRAIYYAARDEPVFFWQEMRSYAEFVVRTLCLVNALTPPEDTPRLLYCCPYLEIAPEDLEARLEASALAAPADALDRMHSLIEETFDLLEAHVTQVDVTASRSAFRNDRRKAWHVLPTI